MQDSTDPVGRRAQQYYVFSDMSLQLITGFSKTVKTTPQSRVPSNEWVRYMPKRKHPSQWRTDGDVDVRRGTTQKLARPTTT